MIRYIKGDIFNGNEDVIVHGCNCFKAMNSGVARQVRQYYPQAFMADYMYGEVGDINKLGKYTSSTATRKSGNGKVTIINAYTQHTYGTDKIQVNYDAMRDVMDRINKQFPTQSIAMPKIGCGLAGGDWGIVSDILDEVFGAREIVVYEYD